jgi:CDP-paratose 2-epimerase
MKLLITGGAGFIGSNTADYYLSKGNEVTILDNLCRTGTKINLEWLFAHHKRVKFIKADVIRESDKLESAIKGKDVIFHLAGQVAVTTSVADPRSDFLTNALGTFNVLEAVRQKAPKAILLYSSTNKVYGGMEDIRIVKAKTRYRY